MNEKQITKTRAYREAFKRWKFSLGALRTGRYRNNPELVEKDAHKHAVRQLADMQTEGSLNMAGVQTVAGLLEVEVGRVFDLLEEHAEKVAEVLKAGVSDEERSPEESAMSRARVSGRTTAGYTTQRMRSRAKPHPGRTVARARNGGK